MALLVRQVKQLQGHGFSVFPLVSVPAADTPLDEIGIRAQMGLVRVGPFIVSAQFTNGGLGIRIVYSEPGTNLDASTITVEPGGITLSGASLASNVITANLSVDVGEGLDYHLHDTGGSIDSSAQDLTGTPSQPSSGTIPIGPVTPVTSGSYKSDSFRRRTRRGV